MTTKVTLAKDGEKTKGGFHKAPFANSESAWNVNWDNDIYTCGKKVSPAN